jgi:DNA-binding CsgD family transcriptional regulator
LYRTDSLRDRDAVTQALVRIGVAAAEAVSLRAYRGAVLSAVGAVVPFDAALYHALSPRVPLETAVILGVDPAVVARSTSRWDDVAVELAPLRARADAELVASPEEVFRPKSRGRATLARLLRPYGMRSLAVVHLVVRDAVHAAVVLMAARRNAFGERELSLLRELAPSMAAGDALHEALDGAPRATSTRRLVCRDERLTARQREIVERVAMGLSNAEIATGLGLSPNTVRNQLARVFARLEANNRADVVRLAVLEPDFRVRRLA